MSDRYLPIYLNDHLAGSVAGIELARRIRASNAGTPLGEALAELCAEIEADQRTLREAMERLQVSESRLKPTAAWVAEKLGRLKPNGQLRGYSPLSRVLELEALEAGVHAKLLLWRALEQVSGVPLEGFDFNALAARAESQRERLEDRRLEAVKIAFAGD